MKRKKPSTARKEPRQSRARATVDAIIEATTHILVRHGYERLTTNHIAVRAGVSIGSVYMYFSSKEAILAALVDRHMERLTALMGNEIARALHQPLASGTERIIDALVRAHAVVDPELHRALQDLPPRVVAFDKIRTFDRSSEALLCARLDVRPNEHALADTKLAAFMVVQASKAIILEGAREHPAALRDGSLTRELSRMIVGYLTRRPA